MAQAFADELEAVQVGGHDSEGLALRGQGVEPRHGGVAVGQVGEFVVQGLALQREAGLLAFGVVEHQLQHRAAIGPVNGAGVAAQVDDAAITAPDVGLPFHTVALARQQLAVALGGSAASPDR